MLPSNQKACGVQFDLKFLLAGFSPQKHKVHVV